MTAVINDSTLVFLITGDPSYIDGVYAEGIAGKYKLYLHISNNVYGTYHWQAGNDYADAQLNGLEALNEIGGLTVTISNPQNRMIQGTFEFAVLNTSRTDTTYVRQGSFTFYYVNGN